MESTDLGIEISEDVIKTKGPAKIERYDFVPQKEIKKEILKENVFLGYRPGMGKYFMGGKSDV